MFAAIKFHASDMRQYWYIVPETLVNDIQVGSQVIVDSPFTGLTVVQVSELSSILPAGRSENEMKEIVDVVQNHRTLDSATQKRQEALNSIADMMKQYLYDVRTCLTCFQSDDDTFYKVTISFKNNSLYHGLLMNVDFDMIRDIDDRVIECYYDGEGLDGEER